MSGYRLTSEAMADMSEINDRLIRSPPTAIRVIDALEKAFGFLAENPGAGEPADKWLPGSRKFSVRKPAHKYVVFFRPVEDGVEILSVVHGARDYPGMFPGDEPGD